jgi:hypothetical protein
MKLNPSGVDQKRARPVISAHAKAHAISPEQPIGAANALAFLKNTGAKQANIVAGRVDDQLAGGAEADAFRTVKLEGNLTQRHAWAHFEIVFQFGLPAVEHQIDAGIDLGKSDTAVLRYTSAPSGGIVAAEIVGVAGKTVRKRRSTAGISPEQAHFEP